jgi:LPXTG-motif cell wall-anchored protein
MPSIPSGNLGAFGNLISFPTGHILTAADTKALGDAAKQMNSNLGISDPLGAGEAKTRAGLDLWINSPWTKATQDQIAASFGSAATQTPGTNLPAIPDVQTAITFVGIILVGVAFLGLGGLIALRKKSE